MVAWQRQFVREPVPEELQNQPSDLDWKRFIQPTDKNRPYHGYQFNRFRASFDFGGGQFTDLFTHWDDAAHMLLGEDVPYSATASGALYTLELQNEVSGRTISDTADSA